MGGTPLSELYIVYNDLSDFLVRKALKSLEVWLEITLLADAGLFNNPFTP